MPHHDFLEMLLADEVARRDREATLRRAKAAHLDPQMQLQAWDDSTEVSYDNQLWAELTSLRFLADAYDVLIMGPVGVGKTFLANALGHIAVPRPFGSRRTGGQTIQTPQSCSPRRPIRRSDEQVTARRPPRAR